MLTFTSLGSGTLRCVGAAKPFVVFPPKADGKELQLMAVPDESPSHDVLSWPGEYDRGGITVKGIGHGDGQQVSFLVEAEGMRCAFPSTPLKEWAEADIEKLGDVHVLLLPGDGDLKIAQKLLDDVDPRIVFLVPGKDGSIHADLLKACGAMNSEPVSEYKLKGSLPTEAREVVVFG
jgi:hypothetical protein